MVSVCIFVLRDVIRKMQQEFQTPFNSFTHTSPSTEKDIKCLCDYLEAQHLQTYDPQRENNTNTSEAWDLIQTGSEYVDTPSAFRNFSYTKFNIKNHGLLEATATQLTDINADVDDVEDLVRKTWGCNSSRSWDLRIVEGKMLTQAGIEPATTVI